jgi:hypothetical protein
MNSPQQAILQERGKSGRYNFRKGYANVVRRVDKMFLIGLDENE